MNSSLPCKLLKIGNIFAYKISTFTIKTQLVDFNYKYWKIIYLYTTIT